MNASAAANALQGLAAKLRLARAQDNGNLSCAKALRFLVEGVLLDEFGNELQLDPALNELVEHTCRSIEEDSGSAALLAEVFAELQALSK